MKRTPQQILSDIQALCQELEASLRLEDSPDEEPPPFTGQSPNHEDDQSLVGQKVIITTSKENGVRATVLRKRSPEGTPRWETFWYLKLQGDGREIWRKRNGFRAASY